MIRNRMGFWSLDNRKLYVVPKSDGGVDERFIPFYKLKLLAGRNFRSDNPSDQTNVIISREAARVWAGRRKKPLEKMFSLKNTRGAHSEQRLR